MTGRKTDYLLKCFGRYDRRRPLRVPVVAHELRCDLQDNKRVGRVIRQLRCDVQRGFAPPYLSVRHFHIPFRVWVPP